jgi:hypothetical protein
MLDMYKTSKANNLKIDALCINQANPHECSAQILRMRAIYSGARSVVVSTKAAIEPSIKLSRLLSLINLDLSLDGQNPAVYALIDDETVQGALIALSRDEYWKRIWIIQEFAIGSKIELLVGNFVTSSKALEILIRILKTKKESKKWDTMDVILDIRESWQNDTPFRLLDMLYKTRTSRCQRRHDRLFGILGLVQDGLKYLPEPNYEADLDDIAVSLTRSYIDKYSLDIILLGPHHPAESALPSWSADYFRFDQWPPEQRVVDIILGTRKRRATGFMGGATFQGSAMLLLARRIETICSLGMAASDPEETAYPMHNRRFRRDIKLDQVMQELYTLMFQDYDQQSPGFWGSNAWCWFPTSLPPHKRLGLFP